MNLIGKIHSLAHCLCLQLGYYRILSINIYLLQVIQNINKILTKENLLKIHNSL